uniref:Uncharacterized protein n=1 Tax=Mucochytrium quahogii TaxID=96639 RepID=A0A7S2SQV8_9STRA|mmetsp:Transcript_20723/g.33762  ORF Transcript_20723/g.33762 Transcript_20723/m.33762 type:complete len:367 (-) Transcript_20723:1295-2395(-)
MNLESLEQAILGDDVLLVVKILDKLKVKQKEAERMMGAYSNFINRPFNENVGMNALHLACQTGNSLIIAKVLSHNPDLVKMDGKLRLPIHCACESGKLDAVKRLVEKLDEKNYTSKVILMKDKRNLTPLHVSCKNPEMLKLLAGYARFPQDVWNCDGLLRTIVLSPNGFTLLHALHETCDGENVDKTFLNKRYGDDERTLFIMTCEAGCEKTARLLLKLGADPTLTDTEGQNGMHWACCLGHDDLIEWLSTLLDGALASCKDENGKIPSDYIVRSDDESSCEDEVIPEHAKIGLFKALGNESRKISWRNEEAMLQAMEEAENENPPDIAKPQPGLPDHGNVSWRSDRATLTKAMDDETETLNKLVI